MPHLPRNRYHRLSRKRRHVRHAQQSAAQESPRTTKLYEAAWRLTVDMVNAAALCTQSGTPGCKAAAALDGNKHDWDERATRITSGSNAAIRLAGVVFRVDSPAGDRAECLSAESARLPGCPDGLGRARSTYVRRQPESTVLHHVVRAHLETFLAEACLRGGGAGVPRFVERELREFLIVLVFVLVLVVVFVGTTVRPILTRWLDDPRTRARFTIHDKQGGCRWR